MANPKTFVPCKDQVPDWWHPVIGAGRLLRFAAAPTFAAIAIVSIATARAAPMMCSAAPLSWPLDGMSAMYLLMAVFHLPPWLLPRSSERTDFQPGEQQ